MTCIFCRSVNCSYSTEEHVVPESLGGGDWSLLPPQLVCDQCQNYFGTKIEKNALADAPFNFIRTFLSLPTKKRRAPKISDPVEGTIEATGLPNFVYYDPPEHLRAAAEAGNKSQMRFPTRPKDPRAVCRFLLKIGVEVLALRGKQEVLQPKYDAAREFARRGMPGTSWWYIELTPEDAMRRWLVSTEDLNDGETLSKVEISEPEPGLEILIFRVGPAVFMTPLLQNIVPQLEGPQFSGERRIYHV